ncbi:MAG: hypothetical protein HOP35_11135 [Nitrospira sp.]|nr:hypothetical protein [Nitrospira sp.]
MDYHSKMLKKAASGVPCLRRSASRRQVVALRGSTYRSVRLASLLAAALLDGLFEHPAVVLRGGSPGEQPV